MRTLGKSFQFFRWGPTLPENMLFFLQKVQKTETCIPPHERTLNFSFGTGIKSCAIGKTFGTEKA